MKTIQKILILLVIALAGFSCMDEYTEEFTANKPVYLSYEDLRTSVKYSDARELVNPGKIYFKDDFIFINEEFEGVHIINNANPEDPQNVGFIDIPGNVDIAIKNNTLYADSYVDLVAIDISDINNPVELNRAEDVFAYTLPPYDENHRVADIDEEKGVVTGWEITRVRQEMEYHYYPVYRWGYYEDLAMSDAAMSNGGSAQGSTYGTGGSMARFGLYDDYLYAVDQVNLNIFEIKTDTQLDNIGKQNVGWNVETMFIYDDHMFLGTQSGMRVFSLEVATVPSYVSDFWHVTSCDPVVVADGYAYVTLRGGTSCGSTVNRLDVLQLSDNYVDNTLVASYPLNGPYGLGIDDDILFICDGDAGLKVYDVTDKTQIDNHMIAVFPGINTYDVIPVNGFLFMIGDDGFYLYDYSDLQNIRKIGEIPVFRED
ncbi:LVIVD repeat-containing protein [Maribellus mangrovi]|uniref:LVIVD repeat-containing protein n=1 Tax=Maribellus mangrovi TaxID=3133146 RepID=UPI0030EF3F3E